MREKRYWVNAWGEVYFHMTSWSSTRRRFRLWWTTVRRTGCGTCGNRS